MRFQWSSKGLEPGGIPLTPVIPRGSVAVVRSCGPWQGHSRCTSKGAVPKAVKATGKCCPSRSNCEFRRAPHHCSPFPLCVIKALQAKRGHRGLPYARELGESLLASWRWSSFSAGRVQGGSYGIRILGERPVYRTGAVTEEVWFLAHRGAMGAKETSRPSDIIPVGQREGVTDLVDQRILTGGSR